MVVHERKRQAEQGHGRRRRQAGERAAGAPCPAAVGGEQDAINADGGRRRLVAGGNPRSFGAEEVGAARTAAHLSLARRFGEHEPPMRARVATAVDVATHLDPGDARSGEQLDPVHPVRPREAGGPKQARQVRSCVVATSWQVLARLHRLQRRRQSRRERARPDADWPALGAVAVAAQVHLPPLRSLADVGLFASASSRIDSKPPLCRKRRRRPDRKGLTGGTNGGSLAGPTEVIATIDHWGHRLWQQRAIRIRRATGGVGVPTAHASPCCYRARTPARRRTGESSSGGDQGARAPARLGRSCRSHRPLPGPGPRAPLRKRRGSSRFGGV